MITPTKVYPGEEDHRFTITFTAPGPMGGENNNLVITIPTELQPANFDDASINQSGGARVLGRGGAVIGVPTVSNTALTIPLTTIAAGQKVVITYPRALIPTDASATVAPATSAFSATTTVGNASNIDVTKITGGLIGAVPGSGRMQISPISIEDGQTSRTFTLTYTAYTAVTGDIVITPAGIVLDDDPATQNVTEELQNTSSGGYGYVIGSASPSGNSRGTLAIDNTVTNPTITWEGVELAKNAKLTTTVRRVHVTEDAGNYEWETRVGVDVANTDVDESLLTDDTTTADIDEVATLTVVNTERDAVKFEVIEGGTVYAADKTSIKFRFTAETTPIRTVAFRLKSQPHWEARLRSQMPKIQRVRWMSALMAVN